MSKKRLILALASVTMVVLVAALIIIVFWSTSPMLGAGSIANVLAVSRLIGIIALLIILCAVIATAILRKT